MPPVYSAHSTVTNDMIGGNKTYKEWLGASPKIQIFDGVMPADADAALSGNTMLVELTAAAIPIASVSKVSADKLSRALWDTIPDATVLASGTAAFVRTVTNDGTQVIDQTDVGESTSEAGLILSTIDLTAGSTVTISQRTSDLPYA